jgi:hypothetical protein
MFEYVNWIELANSWAQWRAFLNIMMTSLSFQLVQFPVWASSRRLPNEDRILDANSVVLFWSMICIQEMRLKIKDKSLCLIKHHAT